MRRPRPLLLPEVSFIPGTKLRDQFFGPNFEPTSRSPTSRTRRKKHLLRNKKTAWLSYLDKIAELAAWIWQDNGGEAHWTLIIDDVLRHASLNHPPRTAAGLRSQYGVACARNCNQLAAPASHPVQRTAPTRAAHRANATSTRAAHRPRIDHRAHRKQSASRAAPRSGNQPAAHRPHTPRTQRTRRPRASQHFALVSSSLFCEPRRNFMSPFLRTHCSSTKFSITPQIANAPQAPHGLLPKTSQTTYFSV